MNDKKIKRQHSKKRGQSPISKDADKPAGPDREAADSAQISSGIPVVGIGGSAGSLDPLKTFFTTMPADSGAAFVVIQHLAPTHESLLTELVAQQTQMKVCSGQRCDDR